MSCTPVKIFQSLCGKYPVTIVPVTISVKSVTKFLNLIGYQQALIQHLLHIGHHVCVFGHFVNYTCTSSFNDNTTLLQTNYVPYSPSMMEIVCNFHCLKVSEALIVIGF